MHKFMVAQMGGRMHYAIPRFFNDAGVLEDFYTDIYSSERLKDFGEKIGFSRVLPNPVRKLINRTPHGIPAGKIKSFPLFGLKYALERKFKNNLLDVYLNNSKNFATMVESSIDKDYSLVYAFNSAALEIFRSNKTSGAVKIIEQTIAPRKIEHAIIAEAENLYPKWASGYSENHESLNKFADRERSEWDSADYIFCASDFVKNGIVASGGDGGKCFVIPYGVSSKMFPFKGKVRESGKLRVLSVGSLGVRKGGHIVSELSKRLSDICDFKYVGPIDCSAAALDEIRSFVNIVGPVPRGEILKFYEWADVFLLPSLCEGSATVTYEAMMMGVPVLCTPNTGSYVEHAVEGYVFDHTDLEGFESAINRLFVDRELLARMSFNAFKKGKQLDFDVYKKRVIDRCLELVGV